jgi:tRNA A-37 threonylcarbamoyl transferase component Bud32/tetratricopeptide (TPR) repeat protein
MTGLEDTSLRALYDLRRDLDAAGSERTREIVDDVRARLFGGVRPAPPARLGRYELGETISYGGMGMVQRARDTLIDREVAIKLCRPDRTYDRVAAERLLQEARALGKLDHPHIVRVLDVGERPDGQWYVVLERIEGPTLAQWLETPRPWREILDVFLDVGDALAATHRARLLHRDVKPSNVLLARTGGAKLIDFGLVKLLDADAAEAPHDPAAALPGLADLTESGALSGTRGFLAPELLAGRRPSLRSDLFSYCVALFWALYRRHPFERPAHRSSAAATAAPDGRTPGPDPTPGRSRHERLLGEYREPTRGEAEVPAWLLRLVRRGLAVDPAQRPATVEVLVAELRRALRRRERLTHAAAGVAASAAILAFTAWATTRAVALPDACSDAPLGHAWASAQAARSADPALADYLGAYASGWDGRFQQVCAAEHTGQRAPSLLRGQAVCLQRARQGFEAVLAGDWTRLSAVDDLGLPDLADCDDEAIAQSTCNAPILASRHAFPARTAEQRLEQARLAVLRGELDGGLRLAADAVALADAVPFAGFQARIHFTHGDILYRAGRYPQAVDELQRARDAALLHGCRDVHADALSRLNKISARVGDIDPEVTEERLREQMLVADILGPAHTRLADAFNDRGLWHNHLGTDADYAAALPDLQRAIHLREQLLGRADPLDRRDRLALAESYLNLATALRHTPDDPTRAADDALARSAEQWRQALGSSPDDPSLYRHHLNAGHAFLRARSYADADSELQTALRLAHGYGDRSLEVARVLLSLADLARAEGRPDAALALAREAADITADRPDTDIAFDSAMGLAQLLMDHRDPEQARERLTALLPRHARPDRAGEVHARLALACDHLDDVDCAAQAADAAIASFARAGLADHPYLATAYHVRGRALAGAVADPPQPVPRADAEAARAALDAAVERWRRLTSDPLAARALTFVHLDLAFLECEHLQRPDASRRHAEAARRLAEQSGEDITQDLADLRALPCT